MPGVSHQGGSVQYEDTLAVDNDAGQQILGLRNDAEAIVTTADLSHSRVSVDDTGRLNANANLQVGDADATAGNPVPVDVVAIVAPLGVVGGGTEAAALRVTIANDSTGLLSVDDSGGSLTVDQATHDLFNVNANMQVGDADVAGGNPVPVNVTAIVPGTGATNLGKQEDELHTTGDVGAMMLGVRNDTRVSICNADGDYTPPSFDDAGAMLVNVTGAYAGAAYVDAAAANVHEPAINTAAVVTYAAGGGSVRHFISGVAWSYDGAPTGGVLTITDGGATVFTTDITAGGPGFQDFAPVLRFAQDSAVVVTLGAAVVTGIVSVKGHWSA